MALPADKLGKAVYQSTSGNYYTRFIHKGESYYYTSPNLQECVKYKNDVQSDKLIIDRSHVKSQLRVMVESGIRTTPSGRFIVKMSVGNNGYNKTVDTLKEARKYKADVLAGNIEPTNIIKRGRKITEADCTIANRVTIGCDEKGGYIKLFDKASGRWRRYGIPGSKLDNLSATFINMKSTQRALDAKKKYRKTPRNKKKT